jgi:hypothetical protein
VPTPSTSIETIKANLDADLRWRERRHPQWTTTYQLYRDTVITNRLTQRQSLNVPLMKETIRTLLSRSGEAADLAFEDYGNDGQRELLVNAYWDKVAEENKYELLDVVDKKNVGLYGRSYTKLNILDGEPKLTIHDTFDILVDRYALPWNIDTARRVTHVGIFQSLSAIVGNPLHDKTAVAELTKYFKSDRGLVKAAENAKAAADKAERMESMGAPDAVSPLLGETYVEMNEIHQKVWHEDEKKDVIHVIVTAEGRKLMEKPLTELLNVNFFLFTSWTDDVEATDWNCDGTGDVVRVPNQIMNAYFSQLVENGLLRGYGMNFYDSSKKEGWTPAGYIPEPWGFYPLPGKPSEVLQHIDIPELASHMEEMAMMKNMVQTATATPPVEKGDTPKGPQTLGEIELLVAKADERLKDIPKFARIHAKQLGHKWAALVSANTDKLKPVTLYKKSASGKYYPYDLTPAELKAPQGYNCVVTLKSEKEADSLKAIQKLKIVQAQFPTNVPLQRITKERMLAWLDLPPDEKREVMDFEDQVPALMPGTGPGAPVPGSAALPPTRQTVGSVINQGIPTA